MGKARKAYVAALTAGIAAIGIAVLSPGITLVEGLITLGGIFATFLATYRTGNASKYDGAVVVDTSNPLKTRYSLELVTPFDEMEDKPSILLQVVR